MSSDKPSLTSLAYEEFVAESFRILQDAGIGHVTRNRHIKGNKSGHEHQFDIVVEMSLLGIYFLVVVECKCYRRRIDISEVLEFASRLEDVSAQKGVMVTTVGYQEGAIRVAETHGIALIVTAPEAPSWMLVSHLTYRAPTHAQRAEAEQASRIHSTIIRYRDGNHHWGVRAFEQAWKLTLLELARELVRAEVRRGAITLQLCCQGCDRPLVHTQQRRGRCPKCDQVMLPERFEGGVWYRCDCGKMLHRTDLVVEVALCECGSATPAKLFDTLREAELERLYRLLNVHDDRRSVWR